MYFKLNIEYCSFSFLANISLNYLFKPLFKLLYVYFILASIQFSFRKNVINSFKKVFRKFKQRPVNKNLKNHHIL